MEVSIQGARVLHTFRNVPIFGTVQITQTLAAGALVTVLLSALLIWLGSGLRVTGISRKQAAAEMLYCALVKFVRGNMGPDFDRYIPLIGTIFATSVVSNLISLLGIWSPTADLMTTLAWSLVVFAVITYHKLRALGLRGYLRSFLEPISLLLPVNILSECFTPLSMTFRHFGNILSGTVIGALIYAALTAASSAFFSFTAASPLAGPALLALGTGLLLLGRRRQKRSLGIAGMALAFWGFLALIPGLGTLFPWLTVGIPAIPSLYFDWFGGCIQAFIFCTLSTLFIRQAAGH